mmetsp:Transcript_53466/g.125437  ORF Transcript_53466/g.125437 Transcript_53466/m.125437 type:complete len:268 (-) Transcript_53466:942-1745(-)
MTGLPLLSTRCSTCWWPAIDDVLSRWMDTWPMKSALLRASKSATTNLTSVHPAALLKRCRYARAASQPTLSMLLMNSRHFPARSRRSAGGSAWCCSGVVRLACPQPKSFTVACGGTTPAPVSNDRAKDVPSQSCGAGALRQATARPARRKTNWLKSFSAMIADSPGVDELSFCKSTKYISTSGPGSRCNMAFRALCRIASLFSMSPPTSRSGSADSNEAGPPWKRSRQKPSPEPGRSPSISVCLSCCNLEPVTDVLAECPSFRSTRR